MFIYIPLTLIVISIIGIALIVGRKIHFLKKLTPESHDVSENIFDQFFPELFHFIKAIKIREYFHIGLLEVEKLLRRLRVVSLKIDRSSESLIKRIRKIHLRSSIAANGKKELKEEVPGMNSSVLAPVPNKNEQLKKEEQELIIGIAKNPKNPMLYEQLGDLYLKMGNLEDARDSYSTALNLDPSNEVLQKKHASVQ